MKTLKALVPVLFLVSGIAKADLTQRISCELHDVNSRQSAVLSVAANLSTTRFAKDPFAKEELDRKSIDIGSSFNAYLVSYDADEEGRSGEVLLLVTTKQSSQESVARLHIRIKGSSSSLANAGQKTDVISINGLQVTCESY